MTRGARCGYAATAAAFLGVVSLSGCGAAATRHAGQATARPPAGFVSPVSSASARREVAPGTAGSPSNAALPARSRSFHPRRPTLPLSGEIVGIDPGHNGRNDSAPGVIDRPIWNGREMESCNTTGTQTDSGYTESRFNFNVASALAALLRAEGARVVMTRHTNDGIGPCVNTRARIIDSSHANVAIDIHADGGPPDGRGVAILEPVADGPNDRVITASRRFGADVLRQMELVVHMPPSTYDGTGGIVPRDNLAGLNLTTVPEVLIESGNMRNATDAALLSSPRFQYREAVALDRAIRRFLGGGGARGHRAAPRQRGSGK